MKEQTFNGQDQTMKRELIRLIQKFMAFEYNNHFPNRPDNVEYFVQYDPKIILLHPKDYDQLRRECWNEYHEDNDFRVMGIPVISAYHKTIKQGEPVLI
jgi:hypothetical protein